MRRDRARTISIAGAGAALILHAAVGAQERVTATPAPVEDQVIVVGKRLEELRIRIERAEDNVYVRFNEINSSDLFDIHCYERVKTGTRIKQRTCRSNAWREEDAAAADGTVRAMQGGSTALSQQHHAKQLDTERRVLDELRQLAHDDPVLRAAVANLGQAYQVLEAVTGSRPDGTLYWEVPAGENGLSFDAQHAFEVRIGNAPWSRVLTARTFTIAGVQGSIRRMRLDCDKTQKKLEYRENVDWTIPDGWGECTLYVNAKRDTTFALYEFE